MSQPFKDSLCGCWCLVIAICLALKVLVCTALYSGNQPNKLQELRPIEAKAACSLETALHRVPCLHAWKEPLEEQIVERIQLCRQELARCCHLRDFWFIS